MGRKGLIYKIVGWVAIKIIKKQVMGLCMCILDNSNNQFSIWLPTTFAPLFQEVSCYPCPTFCSNICLGPFTYAARWNMAQTSSPISTTKNTRWKDWLSRLQYTNIAKTSSSIKTTTELLLSECLLDHALKTSVTTSCALKTKLA